MSNKKKHNTEGTLRHKAETSRSFLSLENNYIIIPLNLSVLYVKISLLKGKLVIVAELTYFHDC